MSCTRVKPQTMQNFGLTHGSSLSQVMTVKVFTPSTSTKQNHSDMSQLDLEFIGLIIIQVLLYLPIIKNILDLNKLNK